MSIIDNAKEVASLVKKLGDIELYRKIVELEGEIIELTREKRELEDTVSQLQASQIVISQLEFDSPFYRNADGSELYCARCIESEGRAIHLAKEAELKMRRRVWSCPQCKNQFVDLR